MTTGRPHHSATTFQNISVSRRHSRPPEKGWAELSNGDLLDQAESEEYELLITTDQSMRYQQNLSRRPMAIIVLRSNRWPDVLLRIDDIRAALEGIQPGEFREVEIE